VEALAHHAIDRRPVVALGRRVHVGAVHEDRERARVDAADRVRVGERRVAGEAEDVGHIIGLAPRHRLVAPLLIAHAARIFLVLREEQHRQQVAAIEAGRTTLGDHRVDDRVELLARGHRALEPRNRQALQHIDQRQHRRPERRHDVGERAADV